MPTARPIIVIILVTKNESSVNWLHIAERPNAIAMPTTARMIGTNAAISAPNTTIMMINASVAPILSPRAKSSSVMRLTSLLRLPSPTVKIAKSETDALALSKRSRYSSLFDCLVEVALQRDRDYRDRAVGRNQPGCCLWILGVELVIVDCAGDDLGI